MKSFREYTAMRLNEAGYARVRRMLWGDVPSIHSVAILTAQNPQGQELSPKKNKELNDQLWDDLKVGNYGPIKVKGQYGLPEDSFMIPNMLRDTVISLGQKYNQDSVIWGQKRQDKHGNPYFRFEFILSKTGEATSVRTVYLGGEDIQGREDFYTQIKSGKGERKPGLPKPTSKKFIIPFGDDPASTLIPGKKRGTVVRSPHRDPEIAATAVESFSIPFFDDLSAELIFFNEVTEPSYYSDKLPNDPYVKQLLDRIYLSEGKLAQKGKTPKFYWEYRGVIRESLRLLNYL